MALPDNIIKVLRKTTLSLLHYENDYSDRIDELIAYISNEKMRKGRMVDAIDKFLSNVIIN